MVCFVTLDVVILLKLTPTYGRCQKTCKSKCSGLPEEGFSMVRAPTSTMSCFFLPSLLGLCSWQAAGSWHCGCGGPAL